MEKSISARLLLGLSAAAAIAFTPAPASAQSLAPATMGNLSFGKSEAILGGSPSRLAAILAQQQGAPLTTAAPTGAAAPFQTASYRRPAPFAAVVRNEGQVSPAVTSGRPDLFGSVALAVGSTPLDSRWRKVAQAGIGGAAAHYARSLRGLDAVEQVEAVNRYVNARVRFVDDSRQFGQADLWSTASATLSRGRGDCEDYAIAKLQMLRAAGFADRDLYLVVLKDLVRRSDHAVLVVRTSGRMLMLDNGTDVVADTETVRDYRPVLTFAANGTWTHGYRRSLPQVRIAQADIKPLAPAAN